MPCLAASRGPVCSVLRFCCPSLIPFSRTSILKGRAGPGPQLWTRLHFPCARSLQVPACKREWRLTYLTGQFVKGSLKSHGCHLREWFDKCECTFIYFDMAYLTCNKGATPYQHQLLSWAVCSGKARKPQPWLPTCSKGKNV